MIRQFILFAFLLLMTTQTFSQVLLPPLETGVSQDLARWRAANYSDVRYKLNITLEKGAPLMKGDIEIRVKLTETGVKNDLVLDWRTTQFQNDKDKPFAEVEKINEQIVKETVPNGVFDYQINQEHLIVSKKYLKTGENTIKIKFASPIKTSGSAITRYIDKEDNREYIYSLFVPSDASTAFPVFDQPDLKARFQLSVVAPPEWGAVSNTEAKTQFEAVDASGFRGKPPIIYGKIFNSFIFEETKPISTYVFAFAAGDFAEFSDSDGEKSDSATTGTETFKKRNVQPKINEIYKIADRNIPKIYVRKSQAEKFKQYAAEVFRSNSKNPASPKLDIILLPEIFNIQSDYDGIKFVPESSVFK